MSAPYQATHAREHVPLPVTLRHWRTAWLLLALGRAETAKRPHEPFPDLLLPGTCNICWADRDNPLHQRRRKARKPGTDPAAKAGWR